MPALAACYFCGDAVDASLEEHAIPPDAPADDQVSVTLCADCHGKLAALLEELPVGGSGAGSGPAPSPEAPDESTTSVGSVLDDEAADDGGAEPGTPEGTDAGDATASTEPDSPAATESDREAPADPASDPDVDPLAGEQEPIFAGDDGTLLGGDDPAHEQADSRPFSADAGDEAEPSTVTEEPGDGDDPGGFTDPITAPPAEDASAAEADGEPAADPPDGSAADGSAADGSTADVSGTDSSSTDPTPADRDASGADRDASAVEVGTSGGGSAQRTGSDAASDDAADPGAADGPLADVSPRTYNRVVRLLQNREFPVDRDDFEALATSAYELDHGECAAALDGAIKKGLLEERGGQLHRPE